MSNKKYYKTVSQQNDNVLVMEIDYDRGGGVLFDLINLTTRELQSGESFDSAFEILKYEYEDLVRTYFIKLGDKLSSLSECDKEITEESFNKAMESITDDMLEKEWRKENEEFDETLGLEKVWERGEEDKLSTLGYGAEEEKTFEPKVAFTLVHKDIQINGFTERTLIELINFISSVKKNYKHMLIKNVDGEIYAMADAKVVHEASFEFEEI